MYQYFPHDIDMKYARLPEAVLLDKALTPGARCVYGILALWVFQGSTASMGVRKIASDLGIDPKTATSAIRQLLERGHITQSAKGNRRHMYHLTSEVFGTRQRAGVREVASGPGGRLRLVSSPRIKAS